MDYGDAGTLHIGKDLRDELGQVLMEWGRASVAANADRDADCADNADSVNGVALPQYGQSWKGGSTVVHPIVTTEHINSLASLVAPLRKQSLIRTSAKSDADKAAAKALEAWLNDTFEEEELPFHYYDFIHNLIQDKSAVMHMGWTDKLKTVKGVEYWDGESYGEDGDPLLVPDDLRDPGIEYQEFEVESQEVEKSGVVYRCVDLVNCYLIPAQARSIETARGVMERMVLTDRDLIAGIDDFDYEQSAVMKLIASGGTLETTEHRDRQQDYAGVVSGGTASEGEQEYECFAYDGYLPYLWESGEANLPKKLWNTRVCVMWCSHHNIVFKMVKSAYPMIPYLSDSLLPTPNSFTGKGLVEIIAPLAQEMTHYTRASSDAVDIEMQPAFMMGAETLEANKGFEFYPGSQWVVVDGEPPIQALQTSKSGLLGMELVSYFEGQCKATSAAPGYGELQTKVRKNGEVANMQAAATSKFDLFQWNAYKMLPEIGRRRTLYQLHFAGGNASANVEGKQTDITEKILRTAFRYSVAQTNVDSSPEAQQARSAGIMALQSQYIQAEQAAMPDPMTGVALLTPQQLLRVYNAVVDASADFDVREPDRYFGDPPQVPEMGAGADPMMSGMASNPMGQMMSGGMNGGANAEMEQGNPPVGFAGGMGAGY